MQAFRRAAGRGRRFACLGAAVLAAFAMIAEPAWADPPPWAPAHGYRAKHKHKKSHDHHSDYRAPFDIDLGRCNRETLGAVLGGAVGAAAGTQIGSGSGRTAAIIGGTVIGFLVGGSIGRAMDEVDQNCVGQVLEHAPDNSDITWVGADNGRYQVAPLRTFQQGESYCREYSATATIGGRSQQTYGIACRQPDGAWKLVN